MSSVFDHTLLGGLFGDDETRAIFSAAQQIKGMLAFEAAYTIALGVVGAISDAQAKTVAREIKKFEPDTAAIADATAKDGVPVPALVAQLRKAAGSENAKAIHTGTTSQDVMDTALSLAIKSFNTLLAERLADLSAAFRTLSERHGKTPIMGRTRMQAALPITFEDRLSSWSHPISQHAERLNRQRIEIELLHLGGPVGNRASLGDKADAIAAQMAAQLGLQVLTVAPHSMRSSIADYAGLLSLISGSLGKMGQDICLMSQQGIDEIEIAGGGGSSAMAHKQNPVSAELLVTLARFNATQLSGMHQALLHEQERSGSAWMLEWMILPQMAQTTARSLSVARSLAGNINRIGQTSGQNFQN